MSEVELVFKVLKEAGKPLKSKEIAELAGLDKKRSTRPSKF